MPRVMMSTDAPHPPDGPAVTWIGHASVLIDVAGVKVLTDPLLTRPRSPTCGGTTPSTWPPSACRTSC